MPVEPQVFKAAMGSFASGVTVVTTHVDGVDHGMTASAFCSLSLDPPLVLVCVDKKNTTAALLDRGAGFAVNVLARDQVELSNRFAGWGPMGKAVDKFVDQPETRGTASRARLLPGTLATIDCSLHSTADGGDHTIYIGLVEHAVVHGERDDLDPLLYFAGRYRAAGDAL